MTDKPSGFPVLADNIPPELKNLPQWVLWRYEIKDGRGQKYLSSKRLSCIVEGPRELETV